MKATAVLPSELGPGDRLRWEAFTRDSSLGSPFLSWQFTSIVGQVRGDARVAVVDDGSGICAYLPFQAAGGGTGRPIGATISDAQAILAPPGWSFDAAGLVAAAGLRTWSFDHITTTQPAFVPYYRQRHRSPIVNLKGGYDGFVEQLRGHSKEFLSQVGRRSRKLAREVGPVVCEWQSAHPDADMAILQRWKSEQYGREGSWDRFAQPWIVDVVRALAEARDPGCSGVLSTLRAGDRLVAAHFGLLGADRLSWWFPAYDPAFGRYSPGLILLLGVIEEAARRQVASVDLGRGEHGYKLRVTPHFYEVAEGEVVASRP